MDDCSSGIKLISLYLDGELDMKGSALVQAHIRDCAPCREAFAAEQEFLELVRACARPSRNERGGKGGDNTPCVPP
jgi:predicted anti-sigma-YlaC factor YlaD